MQFNYLIAVKLYKIDFKIQIDVHSNAKRMEILIKINVLNTAKQDLNLKKVKIEILNIMRK